MSCVKIMPCKLQGTVEVPASKSLCHRAIIAAGLTNNSVSCIENVTLSGDILATCSAMKDLGAEMEINEDSVCVKGNNLLYSIKNQIDCKESASTLRFLLPIALLTAEEITFTGERSLNGRPLQPYVKMFEEQGIKFTSGNLPITVQGMLEPGEYRVPGNVSSQFISGLLFALPLLSDDSTIKVTTELESRGYVDLTIDILKKFSVIIENREYKQFFIKGNQQYKNINYKIEGDFSQAAFWLAAGLLGGKVECRNLNLNSKQGDIQIMDIIHKMGGRLSIKNHSITSGASATYGIKVDASNIPDLVPILAVMGAVSEGEMEIRNAYRLRTKECDRLKALASELGKLGADITELEDGLLIKGRKFLKGGVVDSWGDHRIAMALAIASLKCEEEVVITGAECVNKSYPNFFEDFSKLGGIITEAKEYKYA